MKGWGVVLVLDSVPSRTLPDAQGKENLGETVVGDANHLQIQSVADLLMMRCRRQWKQAVSILLTD